MAVTCKSQGNTNERKLNPKYLNQTRSLSIIQISEKHAKKFKNLTLDEPFL